jgi:hypothetical protein
MPCYRETCHIADRFFLDVIEKYLSTDTLHSSSLDPDNSISFQQDSKEVMLVQRSDIACCVDDPDTMMHFFRTGKISRKVCDVFFKCGEQFKIRWPRCVTA